MEISKKIKIIAYAVEAVIIILLILSAVALGIKNKTIKEQQRQIAEQTVVIDSLDKQCKQLGAMDAITVNATFNVNNKNIFSINTTQADQVLKTYATITRQEILDSILLKKY